MHPGHVGGVDDVARYHHVFVDKLGRIGIVGMDAPYLGRRQIDLIDAFILKKHLHFPLVYQIQLGMAARYDFAITFDLQLPRNR